MIGAVSAASDTSDDIVKSELTNNKISHTNTNTMDVAKTNTNINTDKKTKSKSSNANEDKLSKSKDKTIKTDTKNNPTYTDLNNTIQKNITNHEYNINLTSDYTYQTTDGEDLKKGITIDGTKLQDHTLTINGNGHTINGNNNARIFTINNQAQIIIKNLKITQGKGQKETILYGDANVGGAIYINTATVTIINSTLTQNQAEDDGGAIYTKGNSQLNITNTQINNNQARYGGAIYTTGDSQVNITNTQINNNQATDGDGGAICTTGDSQVNITNTQINNNQATGEYGYGGAIATSGYSQVNITNTQINNNKATYEGGAIVTSGYSQVNVTHSLFKKNNALYGKDIDTLGNSKVFGGDNKFLNKDTTQSGGSSIIILSNSEHFVDGSFTDLYYTLTIGTTDPPVLTRNYTYTSTAPEDYVNDSKYLHGIPITTNMTINGNGYTIDGNNTARIFNISNKAHVTINNITLTQGKGQNEQLHTGDRNVGGAIYINNATVTIINSTLTHNNAKYAGGAIHNTHGNLTINNTNLTNNNAEYGGAIHNYHGNLTISNSQFTNNNAWEGGAIYTDSQSKSNVTSSLFIDNNANNKGSAIYGDSFDILTVNHNIFLNNGYYVINLNKDSNVNLDYNWFGNTAKNYNVTPDVGTAISNWLFLNATANPDPVTVLNSSNITFELYLYNSSLSSNKVSAYDYSQLKKVNLTLDYNPNIDKRFALLGEKILYTASKLGIDTVTAHISNVKYDFNIEVTALPTNITVDTDSIILNATDNQQINAQLNPSEAGTLKYISNDTSVASVDEYGMVTAISKGTALITVYFNGEGYYAAANNKTVLITVNLKQINTQLNGLTIPDLFEGKTSNIIGTLTANNTGFANQKITITLTNTKGYKETFTGKTDANGQFNIKVKPGVNGPVTILTLYNGTTTNKYDYKQASNSTNMDVQKVLYNIKLDTLQESYDYQTSVNITGQITSNYQPLDVKNVNITINGVRKTVALNSTGGFKYTSPYTTEGLYKVLVNCSGTTKNTQYFIKYPTEFIIKVTNSTTDKAIKVAVTESNGFTGVIKVNIAGKQYPVTLNKGKGTNNNIQLTKIGTYKANINYPGNNTFNATTTNSNPFTIKYPTKFTIPEISNTTTNKAFIIIIKESNRFTGTVNVKIGKKDYKVQLQNGEGKQNIKINTPGTYTASIKFPGNQKYTKTSTNSNKFTIKYPTKLTITKIPDTTTNKTVTITIKESNGLTGTINMKIDKQNYKVQLQNGKGKQKIKINTPGTYIASIKFPGNQKYTKTSTTSNKFTVKYPTRFTIQRIPNITEGSPIKLTVTEKNKYAGPVIIIIGSETYTVKLNNGLGKKTITPKLAPGKYIARIKFDGNEKYTPANAVSNKFQINKKAVVVKLDTVIVAFKKTFYLEDTNKKYNVTLKDVNGRFIKNALVTLKVKGKTYKTKTDKKGLATFDLNNLNQKGKYTTLIKYAGDKNYKPSNKKVKITVKIRFTTISKGSKDKKTVKKIQKALKNHGYYLHAGKYYLKIDGIYYTWTEKEVKRYQKNNKLPVTGKVDYNTAIKLGII